MLGLGEWLLVAFLLLAFLIPFARRQFVMHTGEDPAVLRFVEYGALIVMAVGLFLLFWRIMSFVTLLVFALGMLALVWFFVLRRRRL